MVYIKKLEMKGFKSFGGEKVALNFDKGFTAIVGPNGSGKSNILDALCFVLGHLSAKTLRASAFSDLIYIDKKNQNAAKSATVTLHLDNSDQGIPIDSKNVVITRSIDLDGNGAYILNGQRVTRGQILDILNLAGITPDGYNIVFQGQLAQVVSMTPLERRALIEKIAGIAAYDEKKEKAKEELEKAENNLKQVSVLLDEIKTSKEKLLKDKEDAEKWLKINSEIEKLEASIIFYEIKELNNKIEDSKKRLEEKKIQLEETERAQKNYVEEREHAQRRINEIEDEIREIQEGKLNKLHQQIIESRSEYARLNQELVYNGEALKSAQKEYEKLREEEKFYESRLNEAYNLLEDHNQRRKLLEREVTDLSEEINKISDYIVNVDSNFESYTNKFKKLRDKLNTKEGDLRSLLLENEKIDGEIKALREKLNYYNEIIIKNREGPGSIVKKKGELDSKLDQLKKEVEELNSEKESVENNIAKLNEESKEINNKIQLVKETLIEVKTRIEALKETSGRDSSRNRAVEAILELKKNNSLNGIYGTIAELGSVSADYVKAIEVAAGGRLDYIIVSDDEIAAQCISYLKSKRLGRASFLPLNKIKPSIINLNSKGINAVHALDVVKYNKEFKTAFEYVFGRTYIFKDLPAARAVEEEGLQKVTLDGDLITSTGLMVGGYYHTPIRFTLEEERRVPELEKELKELTSELSSLKERRDQEIGKLNQINLKTRNLDKEYNLLLGQSTTLQSRLCEVEASIQEFQKNISEIEEQIALKEKIKQESITKIESLKKEITVFKKEYDEISLILERSEVANANRKLKSLDEERSKKIATLRELDNQITKLETEINAQIKPKLNELKQSITNLVKKIPELEKNVEEKKKILSTLEQSVKMLESEKQKVSDEIESLQKEKKDLLSKLKIIDEHIINLDKEKNSLNLGIARMIANQEAYIARVNELTIKAKNYEEKNIKLREDLDVEKIKLQISELKQEKTLLEPVNQKAIQEYESVEKRFEDLNSRRMKLIVERDTILKFMDELESEKTKVFMKTYRAIDENFNRIFSQLSPSGEAHLELEDKLHPLLGGVRIKAKPAGREIGYLESMSGGEKSLTALALIFAIQQYQPAPFYVFDEIDSALDNANIVKVAELIKELSKYSQFIVITLRDIMMARADNLFGVTKTNNISKIVSVKLEEGVKYAEQR
ncbi:MAG: chromosome segregation protein SMC [Candidatus Odinarchaeum yellowstonii]|uniref:Chromosome partition protein Smc n=1 Tax=Odinarchaeota yellowstonii (strain LCB_4) TaxID=1841599 RepID=A0AAF0IA66_ODILC|nr:MAG: chromosome segregation protein SMC [Candidatus Odinarchaeum yellowstonii]